MKRNLRIAALTLIAALLPLGAQADLIFSAPPRETPEAGQKVYGPIANALGTILGEKVVYEHPKDWLTYSRRMRQGEFDLVFDGPQFASWRLANIAHEPLVRLKGNLQFVVFTKKGTGIHSLEDLAAKRICALASPNLATVTILKEFDNPVKQPTLVEAKGGMKGIHSLFKTGACHAAVIRDAYFKNKIPDSERRSYQVVWESLRMPNQVITASDNVSPVSRDKIISEFTREKGAQSAQPLFQRFSKTSTHFIAATPDEFEGLNLLLEGVVWGW